MEGAQGEERGNGRLGDVCKPAPVGSCELVNMSHGRTHAPFPTALQPTGMIPILHSPGLMMPGQLGPMRRVRLCSLMIFFTLTCFSFLGVSYIAFQA